MNGFFYKNFKDGNKAGDFETKDIDVPLKSEYIGDIEKIKRHQYGNH